MTELATLNLPRIESLHFDFDVKKMFEIHMPYPANIRQVMKTPLSLYNTLFGLYTIKKYTIFFNFIYLTYCISIVPA